MFLGFTMRLLLTGMVVLLGAACSSTKTQSTHMDASMQDAQADADC